MNKRKVKTNLSNSPAMPMVIYSITTSKIIRIIVIILLILGALSLLLR